MGARLDHAVQVIDITDPFAPRAVSAAVDGAGTDLFSALHGACGVAIFSREGSAFAAVASREGLQLVDLSDPSTPASGGASPRLPLRPTLNHSYRYEHFSASFAVLNVCDKLVSTPDSLIAQATWR